MRTTSRHRRRAAGVAVLVTAALLAVGACGAGNGQDSPSGAANGSEASESQAPTELQVSVRTPPTGLDVLSLQAGSFSSLYDFLVTTGSDGRPAPSGAESWEYSEDGLTLTLHLRDDMTFANGDPVTAAHAAATLDHIRNTPGPNQPNFGTVTSVEAPDDLTVVVRFSEPDVGFLEALALQSGPIGHMDYLADPDQPTNPMASGPYVLDMDATTPGSVWVMHRRDDHWNAANLPFETVRITLIADQTAAMNALQAGEIDWLSVGAGEIERLRNEGFTITSDQGTALPSIRILDREGTVIPALGDLRVRQAINYALDREGMVQALLEGFGSPLAQLFFPGSDAYDESLNELYTYDPDRARELMAEAGYADGFDVTMPSISWNAHLEPVVAQQLSDIGINVTWQPVPAAEIPTAMMGAFPMALWSEGLMSPTRIVQSAVQPHAWTNPFNTSDPELDALLEVFDTTMDAAARELVARDINRFLVENAWDAPLMTMQQHHATRAGITFDASLPLPDGSLGFFGVE